MIKKIEGHPEEAREPLKKAWVEDDAKSDGLVKRIGRKVQKVLGKPGVRLAAGIITTAAVHTAIIAPVALKKNVMKDNIAMYDEQMSEVAGKLTELEKEKAEADLEFVKELNSGRAKLVEQREDEYRDFLKEQKNKSILDENWSWLIDRKEYFTQGIEDETMLRGREFFQKKISELNKEKPAELDKSFLQKISQTFVPDGGTDDTMASAYDALALQCGPATENCESKRKLMLMAITELYPEMKRDLQMQFFGDHERLIINLKNGQTWIFDAGVIVAYPDKRMSERRNVVVAASDYLDYWLEKLDSEEYQRRGTIFGQSTEKNLTPIITTNADKQDLFPAVELGDYRVKTDKVINHTLEKNSLENLKELRRQNLEKLRGGWSEAIEMEIVEPVLSLEKVQATYEDFMHKRQTGEIPDVTDNFTFLEPEISVEAAKYMAENFYTIDVHARMTEELIDIFTGSKTSFKIKIHDDSISDELLTRLINKKMNLKVGAPFTFNQKRLDILNKYTLVYNFTLDDLSILQDIHLLDQMPAIHLTIDSKFDLDKFKLGELKEAILDLFIIDPDVDKNFWPKLTNYQGPELIINYAYGNGKFPKEALKFLRKVGKPMTITCDELSSENLKEFVSTPRESLRVYYRGSRTENTLPILLQAKTDALAMNFSPTMMVSGKDFAVSSIKQIKIKRIWGAESFENGISEYQGDLTLVDELFPEEKHLDAYAESINKLKAKRLIIKIMMNNQVSLEDQKNLLSLLGKKITRPHYRIVFVDYSENVRKEKSIGMLQNGEFMDFQKMPEGKVVNIEFDPEQKPAPEYDY